MVCENRINFYAGEEKPVTLEVCPIDPREVVVVTKADYVLTKRYDSKAVESGQCEIHGNEASVLLKVTEEGMYKLKITVKVGRETRIVEVDINVSE